MFRGTRSWLSDVYNHSDFWQWVGNVAKVALFVIVVFSIKNHIQIMMIIFIEVIVIAWLSDAFVVWIKKTAEAKKAKPFILKWVWQVFVKTVCRYIVWTFTWRRQAGGVV